MKLKMRIKKEALGIGKVIFVSIIIPSLVSALVSFYVGETLDTRTSKRQFFYEFSRTFFDNPKYRDISIALEEQYLYGKGKIFASSGKEGKFRDYDIDDYLGFFYDVYSLADEDLIPYSLVSDQYGYYVCITYKNPEIQAYRERLLKKGFSKNQALGYLEDFANLLDITKNTDCKTL